MTLEQNFYSRSGQLLESALVNIQAASEAFMDEDRVKVLETCSLWCDSQPTANWYGKTAGDMVRAFSAQLSPTKKEVK